MLLSRKFRKFPFSYTLRPFISPLHYEPRKWETLLFFNFLVCVLSALFPSQVSQVALLDSEEMADDFALDLEELKHLQSIAKRPRVVSLISAEIQSLQKLSKNNVPALSPRMPAPIASAPKPVLVPALNYITLSSFSWDQDNEKVKIYISLEGANQDKIEAEFKPMAVDIKLHDVQGKNYRCAIPKLHKEIVPEKCKILVKPNRVIVTLVKDPKGNWSDLHFKEDKLKPSLDKERDPMAGIMDLMKNMYEEGDDEMKRTIAKAWTDARSGKVSDPTKSYR